MMVIIKDIMKADAFENFKVQQPKQIIVSFFSSMIN